jgi:CRISPR/Cas system endoribonuclease Cas6 (RAMP superfamily)
LLLVLLFGLTGCTYYGFSGATIPQEHQTITIVPVENATTSTIQDPEGRLTDLLNERFVERTRLRLETNANEADVVLSGRLIEYREAPTSVSGDERATQNEVTIRAEVQYRATENDSLLLDDVYTQSDTYALSGEGAQSAGAAAQVVLENIADAVFADATSNW